MSYDDKAKDIHIKKKNPELGSDYFCWFVILIDSTFEMDKNYYTQVFLKECN